MNRSSWESMEPILDAALELPTDQRAAYLARACSDAAFRAEVEALLEAGLARRSVLERPAAMFAAPLVLAEESDPTRHAGTRVGPYRVVRELARGGMGSVFLAERADGQFEQHVALKLIKRGMDSDEVHRRFLAERRILARLSHSNIARLLDGGMTPEGQPYFAMEFIDGAPITDYSDAHEGTVEERIRLFQKVCEAVRYAHQNLVVHRDLKPSNILVTSDGQVKLLDFGIAKLLTDEAAESTVTLAGLRVMTPEYASPEQVRGEPVTTATDVYALGAVLYELLSGRRAHQFERRTSSEIERVICEIDPYPPSRATAQAGHPERSAALAGDLDTIVLKALQKDPPRRYPSAEALQDDLARHLDGLPVLARADTVRYRARKFIRRYRVLVGAMVALLLSLVIGLGGTLWQAAVASRQASIAREEAGKANEVKGFLVGIFSGTDPELARGRDISARELLDRGTRQVDTALVGQPEIQAELLDVLGQSYAKLGLYAQADTLLGRAVILSRVARGPEDSLTLARARHWGANLAAQSRFDAADSLLSEILTIARRRFPPQHPDLALTLNALGNVRRSRGNDQEAEAFLREALTIHRTAFGPDDLRVAEDLENLVMLADQAGNTATADTAASEALRIRRITLDADHPLVLESTQSLAMVRQAQGRYTDVERLMRQVVAARRRIYPAGHPTVASALTFLSLSLDQQGRLEAAESTAVEALAIKERLLGPTHDETFKSVNNLGVLRYRMKDLAGAAEAIRRARDGWTGTIGPDHNYTLTASNNLGAILRDLGAFPEADAVLREALARERAKNGDSTITVGMIRRNIGALQLQTGRLAAAEASFLTALAIYRARLNAGHPRIAEALAGLGMAQSARGRNAAAEPSLREALAIRVKAFGESDARSAETQGALGRCLMLRGQHGEAEVLLLQSLKGYELAWRDKKGIAEARARLASFYQRRGEHTEALKYR